MHGGAGATSDATRSASGACSGCNWHRDGSCACAGRGDGGLAVGGWRLAVVLSVVLAVVLVVVLVVILLVILVWQTLYLATAWFL